MTVSHDEFYLCRTLFALIHADGVVDDDELAFAMEILDDVPFSDEQHEILEEDLRTPQDAAKMFKEIKDTKEQAKFFKFAAEMVWADDNYAREEQELMLFLEAEHLKKLDLDALAGETTLEFEDASGRTANAGNLKSALSAFKEVFF